MNIKGVATRFGIELAERTVPDQGMDLVFVKEQIHYLNLEYDVYRGVFYKSTNSSTVMVIFAGNYEKYSMLSVARYLRCHVLYFQDPDSFWYQGSSRLPDIEQIAAFVAAQFPSHRVVFFGQSSGGYAALAASKLIENSAVIAVAPQTFADGEIKNRIRFSTYLNAVAAPDGILDLREYLADGSEFSNRYILTSASETSNPFESFFWLDHMHALRMLDVKNSFLTFVRSSRHSLVFRNADTIARLLYGMCSCTSTGAELDLVKQAADELSGEPSIAPFP